MSKQKTRVKRNRETMGDFFMCGKISTNEKLSWSHNKIERLFRIWLKENIRRFNYEPYRKNRQHKEYYFRGINKSITLLMEFRDAESMLVYKNPKCKDDSDHISFDYTYGNFARTIENTFYDKSLISGRIYFNSIKELYIDIFESIITGVNKLFVKENELSFSYYNDYNSSNSADIRKIGWATESNNVTKGIVDIYPLFEGELNE